VLASSSDLTSAAVGQASPSSGRDIQGADLSDSSFPYRLSRHDLDRVGEIGTETAALLSERLVGS
jgi:hypothetical protein